MTTPQSHLDTLDHLLAELGRALAEQDWSRLSELNARVPAAVAPAMAALRSGELDAEAVRTRLSELQQFVEEANRAGLGGPPFSGKGAERLESQPVGGPGLPECFRKPGQIAS